MPKQRQRNGGIRKLCECSRRNWPKCSHPWHLNFKPKGGPAYRFSLDAEMNRRIESKTEAAAIAEDIRTAIRAGTFRRRAEAAAAPPEPVTTPGALTLRVFSETFLERAGKGATANNRACLRKLLVFPVTSGGVLGDKAIGAITEDDIEAFFAALRRDGKAASTINKYVQLNRALFRWAVKKQYLERNPIADSDAIRREKMAQRHRRFTPDAINAKTGKIERPGEERALLAVAGPHMQRLIVGALETAMRLGELLRLEWRDVDLQGRRITVRPDTTKTRTGRALPMSSRLAAVLEMAHAALAGTLPATLEGAERVRFMAGCYVFGDAAGQRVKCIRKAWDTAVLKAHGHKPAWVGANTLAPESRSALRAIDLHFHDLRHEAGSRLHEAGWPLHHVQQMLGHKSLEQTTTYLNVTLTGLQESMERFDERVARCNPVAITAGVERTPDRNGERGNTAQHPVN